MQTKQNDDEAHAAFLDYVEAKAFADATGDFVSAKLAGSAWLRFLNTFVPDHQKMPVKVLPFRRAQQ
jgi:hypothetical protein